MARLAGLTWRPIPEAGEQPAIRPTQHIYHVSASLADSLYGYWTSPGVGLESHLHRALDGYGEQYVDTGRSADANLAANRRPDGTGAISEESAGLADGLWTPQQVRALVADGRQTHLLHGIPLRICRDPGDPGYGWHSMWGLNTRDNPALNPWTSAVGKVCPGPHRIEQLRGVVLPAVFGANPEEVDDMFTDTDRGVLVRIDKRLAGAVGSGQQTFEATIAATLGVVQTLVNRASAQDTALRSIAAQLGDTKAAVLTALATLPLADLHLTDLQLGTLAHAVVDDLREAGVPATVDEVLAAIVARLGQPAA